MADQSACRFNQVINDSHIKNTIQMITAHDFSKSYTQLFLEVKPILYVKQESQKGCIMHPQPHPLF